MNASVDIQCPTCKTFFTPRMTPGSQAMFCPRCGKNAATSEGDGAPSGSNRNLLVMMLGGCLVGMLFLCVMVVGAGFWLLARVQQPREVAVAPPDLNLAPPGPPAADKPMNSASPPKVPAAEAIPTNAPPPAPPGNLSPGTEATPGVPAPPATLPAVPAPPANSTPNSPAPTPPSTPTTPPPAAPSPPLPPATTTPPTAPPTGPNTNAPVVIDPKNTPKYAWKTGEVVTYGIAVTGKTAEGDRTTRGTAAFSVRQAEPRTTFDGTPLDRADAEAASGTAFFITPQGHLVTCAHVVSGSTKITLRWKGADHQAQVIALEHEHDLAILKIDVTDAPVLKLGDSEKVQLAQEVRAVGYPLSDVLGSSVKVNRGTVAGLIDRDERRLLQIDAAINAGNSGGPIVDESGQVVGVATSKLAGEDISNVGFAVPSMVLKQWLKDRQIAFTDGASSERLDGPELARQVTPAVVMLDVEVGPGGLGNERQFVLSFSGSMNTFEPMPAPGGPGRLGLPPLGVPPFGIPRPFGPRNMGLDEGQLRVDTSGNVHEFRGKEQLPYLCGPLGLAPFEPLPPTGAKKWRVRRPFTLTILKREDETIGGLPRALRPRMPPFAPRAPGFPGLPGAPFGADPAEQEKPEAVLPALETIDYEVLAMNEREITIRKRSELKSLGKPDAPIGLELSLAGEYTIDRQLGLLTRLALEGKFSEKARGEARSLPVKITCERIVVPPGGAPKVADDNPAVPNPAAPKPGAPNPVAKPVLAADEITQALIDAANPQAEFRTRQQALSKLSGAAAVDERRTEVVNTAYAIVPDKNFALSTAAINVIGAWAGKEQLPTLIKLLDEAQGLQRINVFTAIRQAKVTDPELTKKLVDRLFVREDLGMAYQTLRAFGAESEDALLEALRRPDREFASTVFIFNLLREHGGEKSVVVLKELLPMTTDVGINSQLKFCLQAIEERLAKK